MLTVNEMTHVDMRKAVDNGYLCAVCQGRLSVCWGGSYGFNGWVLRCGNDIGHKGITRHDIKYENKIKEHLSMDSTALTTMDEKTMLARVEMARFPQDLTVQDKRLLAQVAITYGFDPLMGEVTIYQGRPFVSIDGRYRKAQETNLLDGVETRPATKQERIEWQIPDGDYYCRAAVWLKGSSRPFVGWGRVLMTDTQGGKGFKPVEKYPQRMAEKRAEAQALRKAFHIPLPSIEDIGSPEEELPAPAAVKVIEVKAKVKLEPEATPQPPAQVLHHETDSKQEEVLLWLKESLETMQWTTVSKYLTDKYNVTGKKVSDMVKQLTDEQQKEFVAEVQRRLTASGH